MTPNDLAPPPAPLPPPAKKPIAGWKKAFLYIAYAALGLRLLLALLTCAGHHATGTNSPPAVRPTDGGDSIQANTGFPVMPGDANVAQWDADPKHDGFVLTLLKRDGKTLNPPSGCAMIPGYMAAKDQPGGTLLVLGQNPQEKLLDQWEVGWTGGDTLPPNTDPRDFNADCGKAAVVLMSTQQITDWIAILNGQPTSGAEDAKPDDASTSASHPAHSAHAKK